MLDPSAPSVSLTGLSEAKAQERHQQGLGNVVRNGTSRTYSAIFRANIINPINIVLFSIGAVMVAIGRVSDAVTSVALIAMNMVIGIIQEIRAKRQLDQIALLTRPKVTLIRDDQEKTVDPAQVVQGDLIKVSAGDQMVVDGVVKGTGNLEVNESLLTGESDLIHKTVGDDILSGSFCVSGSGYYEATQVGEASYANRLSSSARKFQIAHTPLQSEINFILRLLMLLALFIGSLVLVSTILSQTPLMRQVQFAAVIAGLVPNGLFFMVILAYAMGAVRIVRHGALVQQTNAVESLSHVTVLCADKTGTLTANRILYDSIYPFERTQAELERILGDVVTSQSTTNKTGEAVTKALGGSKHPLLDEVPFSSGLRWSAVAVEDGDLNGVYALGAPETLIPYLEFVPEAVGEQLAASALGGKRVLAFAYSPQAVELHDAAGEPVLPVLSLLGFVTFTDELRPHLKETLSAFIDNGISVKVISGDNPQTVSALAKQAGFPGDLTYISGDELAAMSDAEFAQAASERTVFGRIRPEQKEALVETLRAQGQYVAMMGDGVNDVLSLKKADMGIAMESGSGATRNVADMVLLGDSFEALPAAFTEGQRIINGMKDIMRLFLTRVAYSALLIIGIAVINLGFPVEPKHNTLLTLLVVGLPTMALAIWARPGALPRRSMLREVAHFVIPAALMTYIFGMIVYIVTIFVASQIQADLVITPAMIDEFSAYTGITYDISTPDLYIQEVAVLAAQTHLTSFLVLSGLLLVVFVEPPTPWFAGGDEFSGDWRPTWLALILLVAFGVILVVEPLRSFFGLLALPIWAYGGVALITLVWAIVLRAAWRHNWLERFLGIPS